MSLAVPASISPEKFCFRRKPLIFDHCFYLSQTNDWLFFRNIRFMNKSKTGINSSELWNTLYLFHSYHLNGRLVAPSPHGKHKPFETKSETPKKRKLFWPCVIKRPDCCRWAMHESPEWGKLYANRFESKICSLS